MGRKAKKTISLGPSERKPNTAREGLLSPDGTAPTIRNLRKGALAGAIFGCKQYTINECLEKQLFGLPEIQFDWIRNVEAGLPLFLFNFTNRMMHGVYEATSTGQMNIDPFAWTVEGEGRTKFPAQVRFRVKKQCKLLRESAFRDVIKDNYTGVQYFWFELDRTQTAGLLALFKASPVPSRIPCPPAPLRTVLSAMPSAKQKGIANSSSGAGESRKKLEPKLPYHSGNGNSFAALGSDVVDEEDNEDGEVRDADRNWESDEISHSSPAKWKTPSKRRLVWSNWDNVTKEHYEEGNFKNTISIWKKGKGKSPCKAPANSLTLAGGSEQRREAAAAASVPDDWEHDWDSDDWVSDKITNHHQDGEDQLLRDSLNETSDSLNEASMNNPQVRESSGSWNKTLANNPKEKESQILHGSLSETTANDPKERESQMLYGSLSETSANDPKERECQMLHGSLNGAYANKPEERELKEPASSGEADFREKFQQSHSNARERESEMIHGSFYETSANKPKERELKEPASSGEADFVDKIQQGHSGTGPQPIADDLVEKQSSDESFEEVLGKLRKMWYRRDNSMSVLVEEKVLAAEQSREFHDNIELPKDSFTLDKNGGSTQESFTVDTHILKQLEALEKKQHDSGLEIQQLRNVVSGSGKLVEELQGRIKELESILYHLGI